ncbi:hypothetical protein MMC30_002715 [Trapelia coarctata]|nr:hypothetical protein [Trapelia coarctata]
MKIQMPDRNEAREVLYNASIDLASTIIIDDETGPIRSAYVNEDTFEDLLQRQTCSQAIETLFEFTRELLCGVQHEAKPKLSETARTLRSGVADLEKGNNIIEHVVLGVEGLTCVGCENKLIRSLEAIPSVRNLQTSLVLSRAEFDVDLNETSVCDVIRYVGRATGFSCQRVTMEGQELDILVPDDAKRFVTKKHPEGVKEMVPLGPHTVRITYDPEIIGARDLLEHNFDAAIQLAPPQLHPALAAGDRHVRKTAYMTLFSAILTIPVLVLAWASLPREHDTLYGTISLALATVIQTVVAGPFYSSALRSLIFTRVIEMDLLIVLSTTTAYIFSIVSFVYQIQGRPLSTGSFFETSTLLMTFIMLGRLVSALARQKAVESISIRSLQVATALIVHPAGTGEENIDARLLQYGDVFKVAPDSRIATDGNIISGSSEVDESMVTGEARIVEKHPGSSVVAGSINGPGTLLVRLTHLPGNNTISEIASMVDEAKFSKPKSQELADRVARYFVPVVVMLTIITFSIWTAVGMVVRNQSAASAVVQAVTYAVSVLIVSCPCAIGLAVPMVVVIAGGVAAKHGVVFKSADTIEIGRKVSHVVFDKTGTLTQGQLSVVAEEYVSDSKESTSSLILGLISNIKHPVSTAIAKHLRDQGVEPAPIEDITSITGKGIHGTSKGLFIRAGNSRWLNVDTRPLIRSLLARNLTVFCVSLQDDLLAAYGLEDSLRPDAHTVIVELTRRGIAVSLVSGDDDGPVHSVASALGIPAANVKTRQSPAQKQAYVQSLLGTSKEKGKRKPEQKPTVLFIGDGTNDAPSLATASIGLHISADGTGTDIAQSAADAVLLRPSLSGILTLMDLSRAAYRRIVFNFAWAFVYNIFAVLLAAGAFVDARVPPRFAGLGEIVSVLPVVMVAVQLRWFREG